MRNRTKMVHGGITSDEQTGAVSVPIYQVSTYKQDAAGKHRGYEYSRTGNPTRYALEETIANLENGVAGFAFGSGMAAITTVMMLLDAEDHVVMTDDIYGGTYRLMTKVFNRFKLDHTYVDTSVPEKVEAAITPKTRALYIETPTNPLLKITDLQKMSEIAKKHDLLLIVDNTFATPYWQQPIDLGANIVLHSATKYIGGHSDVVAGLVVVDSIELAEKMHFIQNSVGAVLGPHDSWLLMRGIKTLGLRMEAIEENTRSIAAFLQSHHKVSIIHYPGHTDHRGHDIAKQQSSGFGGMISFDVGSGELTDQVLQKVKYFTLAESLGAVESLISVPAKMTHASIPKERREELGITDGLIRLSVGIEDSEDLIEDLEQALE
ncbi:bifunctional cystathionine gamma-lyase/homocysteine desulfhydrase [Oceanobacillus caeni]|uniref:bifunctional cystathionine gamma-lyase/homocysteine desulfhydrase n=1 Tax=Oceanobacillus caeni TaxID=405946 RepID=UPI0006229D68|nr:bifunctional cystathionine gamma-lyase/homocysteine desulfhydrase [Oceanobacillus caeni]KKE80411.1 cystathionine gamma-synthase [Bacilli bacterium VT-13-104]PZD83409.1 bifunctional cystathionine gamma-lyase/homocysteine desulfhydrase [Bacilli bacterium]MCR1834698.1 bifunctional cystathionine gamma-lyase/homocysteine desulfhydrase [Oceanobacillus caeni]PZD84588.1 bifunctional cystathionine gamma-lyase/homocysteine desulfhydrase [Bacilli bacterium]PZD86874.1 bifunctional cystathionine gamma-l